MSRNRKYQRKPERKQSGEQGLITWLSESRNEDNYKHNIIMTSQNREVVEATIELLGFNTNIINITKVREEMRPLRIVELYDDELIIK